MKFDLTVSARTEAGVCCAANDGSPFWLSLKSCEWSADPQPGRSVSDPRLAGAKASTARW